ncbi:MAG: type II toxin-antitoxin system RelE/ParE family toxin [Rickettsiales bacterium]|jgi:putative addiction module killer protein|nr:type II toxin-antitoxin system RelE/ParE family toxin [Rickettsiales bacterium]
MIVRTTDIYDKWFRKLRDENGKAAIVRRIRRIEQDDFFGDHKTFGGIGELRVDIGSGYRVYYARRGEIMVILLCGSDKDEQQKNIDMAKGIEKEV